MLKLDKLSLLRAITLGKSSKAHPCNTKNYRIYGGLNVDDMVLLQQGVLKNDAHAERIPLNIEISKGIVSLSMQLLMIPCADLNFSRCLVAMSRSNPSLLMVLISI